MLALQPSWKKPVKLLFSILFWMPVAFFSLLLVYNTIPYFSFSQEFSFIEERIVLFAKPLYSACFYIHIFAGMWCISTALLQFSSWILKKRKKIHIWSGKIYVFVVLILGAPTGMYMSFFAKGSMAERFAVHVHGYGLVHYYGSWFTGRARTEHHQPQELDDPFLYHGYDGRYLPYLSHCILFARLGQPG